MRREKSKILPSGVGRGRKKSCLVWATCLRPADGSKTATSDDDVVADDVTTVTSGDVQILSGQNVVDLSFSKSMFSRTKPGL